MVRKVFSVYDSATKMYMNPFQCIARGEAERIWIQAVNDPKAPFLGSPGDFSLFEVGEFDDHTGQFRNGVAPELVSNALSVVRGKELNS